MDDGATNFFAVDVRALLPLCLRAENVGAATEAGESRSGCCCSISHVNLTVSSSVLLGAVSGSRAIFWTLEITIII